MYDFVVFCIVLGRDVRRERGELASAGSYNPDYVLQKLQPQLKICEVECGWRTVLHYNADTN